METSETKVKVARKATILKINGKELPVLKYAFPTKFAPISLIINDVPVTAGVTNGRGKSYTYFIVGQTGLYVAEALEDGSVGLIDFPENFKFDEESVKRVSVYKKKVKAEDEDADTTSAPTESDEDTAETAYTTETIEEPAPRAKRRK